jgi:DNA-binding NarL/FixJ family response regulator
VFVADHHPVFRAGITKALCCEEDVLCVGETGEADKVLDNIGRLVPDVLVIDGSMLDRGLATRLKTVEERTGLATLVIAPPCSGTFVALLTDGLITNCVGKTVGKDQLVASVRQVARGERVTGDIIDGFRVRSRQTLTIRELSVLALAADGFSNLAIARQLCVSRWCVDTLVRQLLYKLDARDRTHAVTLGFTHGLLDVS